MKPTISGFSITTEPRGFAVRSIYELFHQGTPTILAIHDTYKDALEHMRNCLIIAINEYEWCKKRGCSFPYND